LRSPTCRRLSTKESVKSRTAVVRSGWTAKGRKCKWPCEVAKYVLHSDADFTGCALAKAGNLP